MSVRSRDLRELHCTPAHKRAYLKENSVCTFRILHHPIYCESFGFSFGWVFGRDFLTFSLFLGLPFKKKHVIMECEFCFCNNQGLSCRFVEESSLIADFSPTCQGFHEVLLVSSFGLVERLCFVGILFSIVEGRTLTLPFCEEVTRYPSLLFGAPHLKIQSCRVNCYSVEKELCLMCGSLKI